ncbi:Sak4-like ssDNA annealing protein [Yersinia phage vB_YenM_P744]
MKKPKKKVGILSKAKQVSELSDEGLTCLFYGRSGTGKTTLCGSFPTPILILDMGERGTDSVSDIKHLEVLRVNDWDELEEIYWELKDGDHNFKSVILDALPGVQQLAINQAKHIARKKPEDQTSQRDMGEATKLMLTWLYNYRDLKEGGINVAYNAHDRIRETDSDDDDAISPEVGPNIMPGISKALMGAVDVIGVTFIRVEKEKKKIGVATKRNVDYCLRIGPHEIYNTKIRVPKNRIIPELIVDPTFDKIVSTMKGEPLTPKKSTGKRLSKNKLKKGTK